MGPKSCTVTTVVVAETPARVESARVHLLQDKDVPAYVAVYRIQGPFLFGALDKLSEVTRDMERLPPIVILRLRNMTAIDGSGLGAFEDLAERLHAAGRTLILCAAREQPAQLMAQAEFGRHVGEANICTDIDRALERARAVYASRHSGSGATADALPEAGSYEQPRFECCRRSCWAGRPASRSRWGCPARGDRR
jgi:SulP family sulfate permease